MKWMLLATPALLMSCSVGDFCDLYQEVTLTDRPTVEVLVANERGAAEAIAVNERTYGNCPP